MSNDRRAAIFAAVAEIRELPARPERLPGEPEWMSGDEIEKADKRYRKQHEEKVRAIGARLFKRLGVEPDLQEGEGAQLIRDFWSARKECAD